MTQGSKGHHNRKKTIGSLITMHDILLVYSINMNVSDSTIISHSPTPTLSLVCMYMYQIIRSQVDVILSYQTTYTYTHFYLCLNSCCCFPDSHSIYTSRCVGQCSSWVFWDIYTDQPSGRQQWTFYRREEGKLGKVTKVLYPWNVSKALVQY